jgi:hypothetical protein
LAFFYFRERWGEFLPEILISKDGRRRMLLLLEAVLAILEAQTPFTG